MTLLVAQALLALSFSATVKAAAHGMVERFAGDGATRLIEKMHAQARGDDEADAPDDEADAEDDPELEVLPPGHKLRIEMKDPRPPTPPKATMPPAFGRDLARFSEHAKNVPTADVLHRIAQTAGWSLTLVGIPKEKIDVDITDADPREAVRQVLTESGAMGVLRRDRLVVVPSPESPGMLVIEQRVSKTRRKAASRSRNDIVKVLQGDIVVPSGTVVQGDVVNVGGSIDLEPGSVVQGDAVSVLGSTVIEEGAVVMGDSAAILGEVEVQRGGQVMGEHIQIGFTRLLSGRRHQTFLSKLGPFGFFPTLALFAVVYLLGLLSLRLWPERVRSVGHSMFEQPVKSFVVGFLCWLLLLPVIVLLCISIVGIPLIPLLPVALFLAMVMGVSSLALRMGEAMPAGPGERFVPPAALGMGIVVLLLLAFVPLLGVPLLFLLQFFALGAAVGSRFGRALPPHVA